mmetsp:Transcript_65756/g.169248  ORF Transcript_65756/g.169248 Transcript_65756/m.169248 type:complete len:514 (-) Transcript_65756:56-1597(-)
MDFDDLDDAEEQQAEEVAAERAAAGLPEEGPERPLPQWRRVDQPQIEFTEISKLAAQSLPGDYYGMEFPYDKDGILRMGAQWLTKAFHKTGVLPEDNAVTKINSVREFVGGGAGLKCIIKVEYKEDKPYLHKELFGKLPHKPGGSDRFYVSCMWNHDRPETIFNIWLEKYVPFRVPKFYFGDICAQTTNYILITESLPWSPKGTKEYSPGDIEPAYDKYMDWELPDGGPMYYLACCKALGKMAGYHKTGRLHPQVNEMFPMPDPVPQIPPGCPPVGPDDYKMNSAKADQLIRFLTETASAVMPEEVKDKAWLETWKAELLHVMDYGIEIQCYCMGAGTSSPNNYVSLTHNNLQIDNAFFFRDASNDLKVGLLDWGVLACGPIASSCQGSISGAQVEVLLGHRDAFLKAFAESYEENGGPRVDTTRMKTMSNLLMMQWACGIISNVTQVLKFTKAKEWEDVKDWMDPKLIDRFQVRAHCTQFKHALQLWRKWDLHKEFEKWIKDNGLPARKRAP